MSRIMTIASIFLLSIFFVIPFLADVMHIEGGMRGLFGFLSGILIGPFAFYITKDM